ncbi:MAG: TolC family protein [Chitinophagaceae bacterium]
MIKIFWCFLLLGIGGVSVSAAQTKTLDFYVQQGLSNSPLLKDYQNQIRSSVYDSLLIRATQRPLVLANGQVLFAPSIGGFGYDPNASNNGNFAALAVATQPLFTKKILQPQFRSIQLQDSSIENSSHLSRLDLKRKIIAQYLIAYADKDQYQSNQSVNQLLKTQLTLLKQMVKQGTYQETDYLTFLVALQSQEITLQQLDLQYHSDVATLNYLCGILDTSKVVLASPSISLQETPLLTSSPFFQQYRIDSLKILNNKALINNKYRPSLSWYADAGYEASGLNVGYKNFGTSFGLNFSVPIYDGHQRKLEYEKLGLAENTREQYSSYFHTQYQQQIDQLQQQLLSTDQLISQISNRLQTARVLIDISKKQLNIGSLRIVDYILSINNYLQIKNNLRQEKINRWMVINQLNYWNH